MLHQFDTDDIRILHEVLDQHMRTLLFELGRADSPDYKDGLRRRYLRLDAIRRRLAGPPVTQEVDNRFQ